MYALGFNIPHPSAIRNRSAQLETVASLMMVRPEGQLVVNTSNHIQTYKAFVRQRACIGNFQAIKNPFAGNISGPFSTEIICGEKGWGRCEDYL